MNVKSLNKLLLAAASVTAIAATVQAQAFDLENVTSRVRAIYIEPENKSGAIAAISAPKDTIEVESKWAPDIDFEYALLPNVGVELLLTIPQKHSVVAKQTGLGNNVSLGSVTHLPPTLTGKYYFLTDKIRPYVGAGLNFTWFTKDDLALGASKLGTDSTSFGPALQAGIDFSVNDNWSISLDAKKVWLSTDVSLGATKLTTVDVNPWILGIGVGYRIGKH